MIKTKIQSKISNLFAFFGLVSLILYAFIVQSGAQPAFSQGFNAEGNIKTGMIVRLKKDDVSTVVPLKADQIKEMHGVVVDNNDAPVTITGDNEQTFVATAGNFKVLVSDFGGPIEPGDYITISLLNGIGMKADHTQPVVLGKALEKFNDKSEAVGQSSIKVGKDKATKTRIGQINVAIDVSRNPNLRGEEPNVPEYLRRAAETIAGKEVGAQRIYAGLVVFAISTLISLSLLYGGVRSGIISIGRNPLSKKLILRGMLNVIFTGITIFLIGVFAVYLLLKL